MGNFGMQLTRSSYGLAEFGETVKLADIRPGDLMFFKGRNVSSTRVGHVALVVEVTPDAIRFIHASTSRGVVIDNFKTSKYYIPRFIKAKRLDYGVRE
jgi:cell wall-associated NlpC family hydrolase